MPSGVSADEGTDLNVFLLEDMMLSSRATIGRNVSRKA